MKTRLVKRSSAGLRLLLSTVALFLSNQPVVGDAPRPTITLGIFLGANGIATLTVSGTNGGIYQISATTDFATWTNWPAQQADNGGQTQLIIPLSSQSQFFRAVSALIQGAEPGPPEVKLGERLFLETRFAQFFFAHRGNDVNTPLSVGDPVLAETVTLNVPAPG